jgi:peptide/nickel transport system permease protein
MAMAKFVLTRLALAVPTILVVATLSFGLIQLIPGSPAEYMLGTGATPEQVAALERQMGLDRPLWEQYWRWLTDAARGDFGKSISTGLPAMDVVLRALPVTLSVAIVALVLTIVLGVALGMLAAVRGGLWDSIVQGFSSLLMAVPTFWLAVLLIFAFAISTRIFAATGYTPITESPLDWLLHVTLPAAAVGVPAIGQVAFQARAAFRETAAQDFLRTLRATGLSPTRILWKHLLRNGLIPVVAYLGVMFVFMLGGVVIVETIFNLPGLGALMQRSVNAHDVAAVQATVVTFTILVVITNLVVDLLVGWLDPRARSDA